MSVNENVNKRELFRALFSVTGVLIVAKIIGFLKQIITAKTFGADKETDLISLSEGFVSNADYAVVQTLTTAFVALYIYIDQKDKEEFVSDVFKLTIVSACSIVFVMMLLAPVISRFLAPSYNIEQSDRLAVYVRVFAPVFLMVILRAVFQALLNANDRYVPGEVTSLNQSIVIIILIIFTADFFGVDTLVLASYGGSLVNLIYMGICARKYFALQKGNPLKNPKILEMLKMMIPLFLGYSMIFVNQQIDKIIVSGLETGTVTSMYYASVLSNLVCTLITSFCTVLFTRMTRDISSGGYEEAGKFAVRWGILLFVLFAPVSVVTVICAKDIVSIAFGRGAFHEGAVNRASLALMGYGMMFGFYAVKGLFSRLQYGNKNTKTPMINNTIGICVNIVLSLVLSRRFGVFGVTLASSIAEMISAVMNIRSARKQNGYIRVNGSQHTYFLVIIFGLAVCIFVCGIMRDLLASILTMLR